MLRTATLTLAVLPLLLGSSVATLAAEPETTAPIEQVSGSLDVHQLPGGTFTVEDRVLQYRDYPLGGSLWRVSDQRLAGYVISEWSWDVHAQSDQPVPAWGTMNISREDGAWSGAFSGVRFGDFEPVHVRAFLLGDGVYDGLSVTLDITATSLSGAETWIVYGVVGPLLPYR